MEMLEHYRKLARYNEWANLEVITFFRGMSAPPDGSLRLMAHIVGAEHVWLARLLRKEPPIPVWPELAVEVCEGQVKELARSWKSYLAGSPELLEQTVAYRNSKGESWATRVHDILTHVFLHSAYHRGQIAADMRRAGNAPAYTDFIHGVRQGLVE
jgi:uncharacterized damage-inducible protein DinB